MHFIAVRRGFIEDVRILNNKYQLDTTPDIRKAKVFTHYSEADQVMRKAGNGQYFAILSNGEQPLQKVPVL